jgi:hypothetical protein
VSEDVMTSQMHNIPLEWHLEARPSEFRNEDGQRLAYY